MAQRDLTRANHVVCFHFVVVPNLEGQGLAQTTTVCNDQIKGGPDRVVIVVNVRSSVDGGVSVHLHINVRIRLAQKVSAIEIPSAELHSDLPQGPVVELGL